MNNIILKQNSKLRKKAGLPVLTIQKLDQHRNYNQKGFTLVELLVTIVIIVVLAAIIVPTFLAQKAKANDAIDKYATATVSGVYRNAKGTEGTVELTSENTLLGHLSANGSIEKINVNTSKIYSNNILIAAPNSGSTTISITENFCVQTGRWRQMVTENEPVIGVCVEVPAVSPALAAQMAAAAANNWDSCSTIPTDFTVYNTNFAIPVTNGYGFTSMSRLAVDKAVLRVRNQTATTHNLQVAKYGASAFSIDLTNVKSQEELLVIVPWYTSSDTWILYEVNIVNDVPVKTQKNVKALGTNAVSSEVIPLTATLRCAP